VHSHKNMTLYSIMSVVALGLYSAFITHSFRIKLLKLLNLSQLEKTCLFGKVNNNLSNDLDLKIFF